MDVEVDLLKTLCVTDVMYNKHVEVRFDNVYIHCKSMLE